MQNNNISKPHPPSVQAFLSVSGIIATDEASWSVVALEGIILPLFSASPFVVFSHTYSSVTVPIFLLVLVGHELLMLVREESFLHSWI